MDRQVYETGFKLSRLSVILISIVTVVWVNAIVVILFIVVLNNTYYKNAYEMENFVEEFFNTSISEEACKEAPIFFDQDGNVSENSLIDNTACIEEHQKFMELFPQVSAVYIISWKTDYDYETYDRNTFKVVALTKDGEVVEELSKITIPFVRHSGNPYYMDYYTIEYDYYDGYIIRRQIPKYGYFEYGIDDGSDTWWAY